MKKLGIIGGLSWHSSLEYYKTLNEMIEGQAEGQGAKIILNSLDFYEITELFKTPQNAMKRIAMEAKQLEDLGCDHLIFASNTVHFCFDYVQERLNIPILHIADAVGGAMARAGVKTCGLLGTRYTMNQDFYKKRLQEQFQIDVLIPPKEDRQVVDRIIYDELVKGQFKEESRQSYLGIIQRLQGSGAKAIIMGCTEIPLLISQGDTPTLLIDSTREHCKAVAKIVTKDLN